MNVFKIPVSGALFILGSAVCVGASAVLIRAAIQETHAVIAGTFVSYVAAFAFILVILSFGKRQRYQLRVQPRNSVILLAVTGVIVTGGQLLRYLALELSPVSVVQPIQGTVALFVFFLSWVVNRHIDVFNWRVLTAIITVAFGTYLVSS
jgi:drug/metabolite transporter (DMT)-like permease